MKTILIPTNLNVDWTHLNQVVKVINSSPSPVRVVLLNTYLASDKDPKKVIELNDRLKLESKLGLQDLQSQLEKTVDHPNVHWERLSLMGSLRNVMRLLIKTDDISLAVLSPKTEQLSEILDLLEDVDCMVVVEEEEIRQPELPNESSKKKACTAY